MITALQMLEYTQRRDAAIVRYLIDCIAKGEAVPLKDLVTWAQERYPGTPDHEIESVIREALEPEQTPEECLVHAAELRAFAAQRNRERSGKKDQ